MANNLRGIQNIYLGDYNGTDGKGLSDIIKLRKPELDATVKLKITTALNAINAISGTFAAAIFNDRLAVANAQAKVIEVQTILDGDVKDLLSNL